MNRLFRLFFAYSLLFTLALFGDTSNIPVMSITPLSHSFSEGDGNQTITFTISLSEAPDKKWITVNYATVAGTNTASGVNFSATSGTLTFDQNTPTLSQTVIVNVDTDVPLGGTNGTFTFEINAAGGPSQDDPTPADIASTVTILAIAPPTAVDDNVTGYMDQVLEVEVLGNDLPGNESIDKDSVTLISAPSDGNVTYDIALDRFYYTPDANWTGTTTFTYTVDDILGRTSNVATVTITIIAPIPDATDNSYVCPIDGTTGGNIIIDPPYDTVWDNNLTIVAMDGTAIGGVPYTFNTSNGGTVILSSIEGDFNYTAPGSGWNGADLFSYTITNRYGNTDEANVTIYVNNYCIDAITLLHADDNCTTVDANSTFGGVTNDNLQYYKFVFDTEGVLDINLTNTDSEGSGPGAQILYYDFGENCGTIFGKDTTSQLDAGFKAIKTSIPVSAGTYYLGLQGKSKTNQSFYDISVNFRSACAGGTVEPYDFSSIGINNVGYDYDTNQSISTKIVHEKFALRASYLDANGSVTWYDGSYGTGGKTVDMTVILSMSDDTCSEKSVIGQVNLQHLDYWVETPEDLNWSRAAKIRRMRTTNFDFGRLFREASGLNCGASSLNSALCMVPACFNNEQNIRSVFPPAFQPNVLTCIYGDGGGAAPCQSNAYYGNCGGKKMTISPARYDNDLGCAMCLADAIPAEPCSADRFAVRPNEFNSSIIAGDIFTAGVVENLTFLANNALNAPSYDYNETEETSFTADINISDPTKVCQQNSIDIDPPIDYTHGTVSNNYRFNNVGDFNMTIHEIDGSEFAVVDRNDTPDSERIITPYEVQFTVLPDHFGMDGNLTDAGNNFTYLSNFELFPGDRNMSAPLQIRITAEDVNGSRLTNYSGTCYAKDGNLTLNFVSPLLPVTPDATALTKLIYYDVENNTTGSIPFTSILSPFTQIILPILNAQFRPDDLNGTNDLNGTAFINYQINFDRNRTKVVNPIEFALQNVTHLDTDMVLGDDNLSTWADKNATFYYGRVHAPRYRVNCNPAGNCVATLIMYYEVYDSVTTDPLLSNVSPGGQLLSVDDVRWYRNRVHDQSAATVNNDGDIDAYDPRNNAYDTIVDRNLTAGVNPTSSGQFTYNPVTSNRGFPFKVIMEINASNWLIYNKFDANASVNQFELEFNSAGSWQNDPGTNKVGNNAETNTNRRIQW